MGPPARRYLFAFSTAECSVYAQRYSCRCPSKLLMVGARADARGGSPPSAPPIRLLWLSRC
jgi:hypothetical protein